jgi:hypothetical protein
VLLSPYDMEMVAGVAAHCCPSDEQVANGTLAGPFCSTM